MSICLASSSSLPGLCPVFDHVALFSHLCPRCASAPGPPPTKTPTSRSGMRSVFSTIRSTGESQIAETSTSPEFMVFRLCSALKLPVKPFIFPWALLSPALFSCVSFCVSILKLLSFSQGLDWSGSFSLCLCLSSSSAFGCSTFPQSCLLREVALPTQIELSAPDQYVIPCVLVRLRHHNVIFLGTETRVTLAFGVLSVWHEVGV